MNSLQRQRDLLSSFIKKQKLQFRRIFVWIQPLHEKWVSTLIVYNIPSAINTSLNKD